LHRSTAIECNTAKCTAISHVRTCNRGRRGSNGRTPDGIRCSRRRNRRKKYGAAAAAAAELWPSNGWGSVAKAEVEQCNIASAAQYCRCSAIPQLQPNAAIAVQYR
jgi:hypothetical protein